MREKNQSTFYLAALCVVLLMLLWYCVFLLMGREVEAKDAHALPTPIPLAPHVRLYLIDNYAIQDFSGVQVVSRAIDYCMGVYCEYWVIKPSPAHLRIMVRCYPDFGHVCVPTYEGGLVEAHNEQP